MGKRKDVKKKRVAEIADDISKAKVVAIVDLHNLPSKLLHSLRKNLKGKAKVIIYKTSLLKRAMKQAKKEKLLEYLKGEKAVLLSDMDPFMLYKRANSQPLKVYAKPGQLAPYDIVVPKGETSLPPGPVLTELKQAGIDARIQSGKIAVGKDSIVAKEGEKIKDAVAKALQKLDIKPFQVMVGIPAAMQEGIVYVEELLNVNQDKFLSNLYSAHRNANALSMEFGYPTKENITQLLTKASRNARNLGIERNIAVPELVSELVKKAARQASGLNAKVGSS